MRILFVSQLFDPEYSIKGLALMKHWVAQGHDVEVVTTFPNYPTGEIFPGYKRSLKQVEEMDGVKVVRLWSHISHSKSKLSRACSYLSFTLMAFIYSVFTKKPDVLYAYHPQATTGLLGIALKKIRGIPFITDVQDLWPDALVATGLKRKGLIIRLVSRCCSLVYQTADKVVVLSNGFKDALIERGVPEDKIHIVYNWCPEEEKIGSILKSSQYSSDTSKVARLVYAGNIGVAQSLKPLIDAVGSFPATLIKLDLYGGGVEKGDLDAYKKEKGYQNVFFKGYIPSSQIFNLLAEADMLAIHLRDEPLFKITIPSKTQSSMAMGRPVLMAVGGEANQIVEQSGSGVTSEPESVEALRTALSELLANKENWGAMGRRARDFYLDNFSTTVNYAKLDRVLQDVSDENT